MAAAVGLLWSPATSVPDNEPVDRSGYAEIGEVENGHTGRSYILVMTMDEDKAEPVDSYSATLAPNETRGFGLLECKKDGLEATRLTVLLRLPDEKREQEYRTLTLGDEDCRPGWGATFLGPGGV